MSEIKGYICTALGAVGGFFATLFGGWTSGLVTLILFMIIDYVSGIIVAGVFHNSNKTASGSLDSRIGWKGLARKCMILLFVLIANRLDLVFGTEYIQEAVIIGFMANELISIVENAGLMGIPLPGVIKNAIDLLQNRASQEKKEPTKPKEPKEPKEPVDDEDLVKELLGEEKEEDDKV